MNLIVHFLFFIFLLLIPTNSIASKSVNAVFTNTPPKIDGKVEEDAWFTGNVISDFFQKEPDTGEPVSVKTVAYVCYDKNNLYFGFQCYENKNRITAKQMARDASLAHDDKIVIILDTFLDKRNAYWFQISPRGSKGDALLS